MPLIHASFFFIIALMVFDIFAGKILSNAWLKLIFLIFFCFFASLSVAFLSKILETRQAAEYFDFGQALEKLGAVVLPLARALKEEEL